MTYKYVPVSGVETLELKRPWAEQGSNLRRARNGTGLSQENFAPVVGTTRRHLIRLEKGWHKPSPALLARIATETKQPAESFGYPDDEEPV